MSDTSYYDLPPTTRITVHPEDKDQPQYLPTGEAYYNPPVDDNRLTAPQGSASWIANKLLGTQFGEERYQTWPERMVRSGFTLPHDVMTGQEPTTQVDPITGETVPATHMLERTQDLAGMAMSGGLAGVAEGGKVVGSGPVRTSTMRNSEIPTATAREQQQLRKAVRESGDDRSFHEHPRQEVPIKDLVATQDEVNPEIVQQKIQGGEYKGDNDAFAVLHDGKYYIEDGHHTVEAARRMGRDTVPMHVQVLNAKNETAAPLSALEKGPIWHSPVENALEQSTTGSAPGKQWLATLQNARGVKPEELEWTGLKDFLTEHAEDKVTRQELHEHMAQNKVQLQDVEKNNRSLDDLGPELEKYAQETYGQSYANLPGSYRSIVEKDVWDAAGTNTKYHDYQLPGGENYREHLLTLPTKTNEMLERARAHLDEPALRELAAKYPQEVGYRSSHWDEPNIVAHVRTNDRMMGDKKSLHIEEVQSDWHQAGRKSGYKSEAPDLAALERKANVWYQKLSAKIREQQPNISRQSADNMATELMEKALEGEPLGSFHTKEEKELAQHWATDHKAYQDASRSEISNSYNRVPDAPFKDTTAWASLAMKRMVRRAAEEGYDRISWTPGEAQAARYDLSKQVDGIKYEPNTEKLWIKRKGNTNYDLQGEFKPDKLPDVIGKEAAERIAAQKFESDTVPRMLEGLDLKVGGEGMREFYDKMLPRVAEKIGKAHGVKVQRGTIGPDAGYELHPPVDGKKQWTITRDGNVVDGYRSESEAREALKALGPSGHPVHYFDIPQSLRDQALQKGMPLFSGGKMFIPATQPQKKDDNK